MGKCSKISAYFIGVLCSKIFYGARHTMSGIGVPHKVETG